MNLKNMHSACKNIQIITNYHYLFHTVIYSFWKISSAVSSIQDLYQYFGLCHVRLPPWCEKSVTISLAK